MTLIWSKTLISCLQSVFYVDDSKSKCALYGINNTKPAKQESPIIIQSQCTQHLTYLFKAKCSPCNTPTLRLTFNHISLHQWLQMTFLFQNGRAWVNTLVPTDTALVCLQRQNLLITYSLSYSMCMLPHTHPPSHAHTLSSLLRDCHQTFSLSAVFHFRYPQSVLRHCAHRMHPIFALHRR